MEVDGGLTMRIVPELGDLFACARTKMVLSLEALDFRDEPVEPV